MSFSEAHWDNLVPLEPIHFFELSADLLYYKEKKFGALPRKYLLPNLSAFYEDPAFAEVAMAWNEEGIFVTITCAHTPEIVYPNYQQGDAVELFFDTRAMKNSSYTHKFCHHFFFLPEPYTTEEESIEGGEITHFRGEDRHELADIQKCIIETTRKRGYTMTLFIPAECLFGYDPLNFDRLGFTYRINRARRAPQFFSVSQQELVIEEQPALWATLKLIQKK